MFRSQQGPPWGTGAPFLKPGLNFRVQKSEFSDILRGFRGQVGPIILHTVYAIPITTAALGYSVFFSIKAQLPCYIISHYLIVSKEEFTFI